MHFVPARRLIGDAHDQSSRVPDFHHRRIDTRVDSRLYRVYGMPAPRRTDGGTRRCRTTL